MISTKLVCVTPAMARRMIAENTTNRNIRQTVVDKYAKDMLDGRWLVTHQGVAVYDDGALADGQHRLLAIISAGVSVWMMVTNGLPRSSSVAIDANLPRAAHDSLTIEGDVVWATRLSVGIARFMLAMLNGPSSITPSVSVVKHYMTRHESRIKFAMSIGKRSAHVSDAAGLLASYACAHDRVGDGVLARFAAVLTSGEIEGRHEASAIKLRDYLISNPHAWSAKEVRHDTARRVHRVIKAFSEGEVLTKLYAPETYIYPAPE